MLETMKVVELMRAFGWGFLAILPLVGTVAGLINLNAYDAIPEYSTDTDQKNLRSNHGFWAFIWMWVVLVGQIAYGVTAYIAGGK